MLRLIAGPSEGLTRLAEDRSQRFVPAKRNDKIATLQYKRQA
jgi:hypothetical protein